MKAFYPNTFALLLTAVSASATKFSTEQPSPQAMAEELGIRLPRLPWHLVDLWWQFEEETHDFEKLEVDVTIDRNVSADYNLYVSPVGIAKINGLQFYGGLQTNVNGWVNKKSRTRVHPGPGGIFSRWSHDLKEPIGLSHVRMAEGGLCESAGYEGQFCSVRRPFSWGAGTYTYSIVKGKSETLEGKPHTWFLCMVRSHETGVETYVGSLRFEGKSFTFWNRNAAFVEVYATSKIPRSGIPKVKVTFGYPRLNGKQPKLRHAHAYFDSNGSPQCTKSRPAERAIEVEVGPMFRPKKTGVIWQRLLLGN